MTNPLAKLIVVSLTVTACAAAISAQLHPQKKGAGQVITNTQTKVTLAKPDVSFQPIVYLTGRSEDEIDPVHNRSVAAGGTINVSLADAVGFHPGQGYMQINVAVIIRRSGGDISKPLKMHFSGKGPSSGAYTLITFAPGQTTYEHHEKLNIMQTGMQKLEFDIDVDKEVDESNENNNKLAVTLNIAPWNVK